MIVYSKPGNVSNHKAINKYFFLKLISNQATNGKPLIVIDVFTHLIGGVR